MHRIFIYTLTGFPVLLLILFVLGLFFINEWILIGVILEIHLIFFVLLYRGIISIKPNFRFLKKSVSLSRVVFISIIVLFFFGHLTNVVNHLGFPPAGDGIRHSVLTSLAVYNQKLTLTFDPLGQNFINEPPGFHSTAAYLTTLLGNYPAESIFILASFLTGLIFLVIFSLTYQLTKSITIAVLGSLFTFWVNTTGHMETWILGYLYNGPYPNIAGLVLVFTSILLYMVSKESEISHHKRLIIFQAIIIIALAITYPPFALIPISLMILFFVINRKNTILSFFKIISHKNYNLISEDKNSEPIRNSFNLLEFIMQHKLFLILIIGIIVLVPIFLNILFDPHNIIGDKFEKMYARSGYAIDLEYFQYNHAGIISILGAIISAGLIIFRKQVSVAIIQLFLFSVLVGSLFFDPLSVFLPIRVGLVLSIISWVIFCVAINEIMKLKKMSFLIFKIKFPPTKININKIIISIVIFTFVIWPSFESHVNGEIAYRYDWFPQSKYFVNDYPVLEWISNNVKFGDLIMTDLSYTSAYLQSFSIQNVTPNKWSNSATSLAMASDTQRYWESPMDLCRLLELDEKFDIKYILLTEERGFRDWKAIGGDGKYKSKQYDRVKLHELFSNTAILKPAITSAGGGLYEIMPPDEGSALITQAFSFPNKDYWRDNSDLVDDMRIVDDKTWIKVKSEGKLILIHKMNDEDWSDYERAEIMWYGTNSSKPIKVKVFGPSNNFFEIKTIDDFIGWKKIMIPLKGMPISDSGPPFELIKKIHFISYPEKDQEYGIGEISLQSCY